MNKETSFLGYAAKTTLATSLSLEKVLNLLMVRALGYKSEHAFSKTF